MMTIQVIQSCPMALQLRYLQTLGSIASESNNDPTDYVLSVKYFCSDSKIFPQQSLRILCYLKILSVIFSWNAFMERIFLDNSTIVFPIPIDLVSSLVPTLGRGDFNFTFPDKSYIIIKPPEVFGDFLGQNVGFRCRLGTPR